jgi:hypothetical protein
MLTGERIRKEEYNIGINPILSPIAMPMTLFRMRVRKMAMSNEKENRIVITVNISSGCLDFSAFLARKKDPNASRINQLARIMPMQSSLPEKTIRSSLKSRISATSPLNPIAKMARQMRFLM